MATGRDGDRRRFHSARVHVRGAGNDRYDVGNRVARGRERLGRCYGAERQLPGYNRGADRADGPEEVVAPVRAFPRHSPSAGLGYESARLEGEDLAKPTSRRTTVRPTAADWGAGRTKVYVVPGSWSLPQDCVVW